MVLVLASGFALILLFVGLVVAFDLPPGGTRSSMTTGTSNKGVIEAIAAEGITRGCNPQPTIGIAHPARLRGAQWQHCWRGQCLPAATQDFFIDDEDSIFENDINKLAESGITRGCNSPSNDRYCPDSSVTRSQMAAFLVRHLVMQVRVVAICS